jgi:uncharacterized protein (DUF1015 family)
MVTIKPFAALRPKPELAARICELPYDVMSSEEARALAAGNPLSFLHVSKPEIDLPPGTDVYSAPVYAKGKENFDRLVREGALRQDAMPSFYLYRQVMGRHSQVGLVAAASCEDYLGGAIKKHEYTRPDKEDDRVRHIETLKSQTGPVFLVYEASKSIDDLVARATAEAPDIDFTANDGVRHTAWVVGDLASVKSIQAEFGRMTCLYIADGHHRSAAAGRVYQSRKSAAGQRGTPLGEDPSAFFLSVLFPHNQVEILPYNRVLKDFNGLSPETLLQKLKRVCVIQPGGSGVPAGKHELGFFLQGHWHTLRFEPRLTATNNPIDQLDVSLLQNHVLGPLFGIHDPRTSERIGFVGGIRGAAELAKLVNQGEYACAFSMFPTGIEDLMAIADDGGIMPPKSTWFEPKLRDAMFCHLI